MRILIVGNWQWPIYEEAFAAALIEYGHEVLSFSVSNYFHGRFGKFQKMIPIPGPALIQLNIQLFGHAKRKKPDVILLWRCTHILPSTIRKINDLGCKVITFNNDDPFGPSAHGNVPWHHHLLWWWYLRTLPLSRMNFFYRKLNCEEAKSVGAKHADVLLPYFIPWKDRPVTLSEKERSKYETDIVFVGHYEPDGREIYIKKVIEAGLKVKIWGGRHWSRQVLGEMYDDLAPIIPAEGEEYAKALAGAKVCLCFLSKLNRDTYTRRCFEIPACGKVMLAERSDDLLNKFKENEEACFFSTPHELVQKAKWLFENPERREQIANAGLRRVWLDGHDVNSRAGWFSEIISAVR